MANTRKSIEIDSWDANVSGLKLKNLTSSTPDKTTGTTFKSVLVNEDGEFVAWPESSGGDIGFYDGDLDQLLDGWFYRLWENVTSTDDSVWGSDSLLYSGESSGGVFSVLDVSGTIIQYYGLWSTISFIRQSVDSWSSWEYIDINVGNAVYKWTNYDKDFELRTAWWNTITSIASDNVTVSDDGYSSHLDPFVISISDNDQGKETTIDVESLKFKTSSGWLQGYNAITFDFDQNQEYESQLPNKSWIIAHVDQIPDVSGKENTSNKATDLTSPDNTKYPTTQAVATAIAAIPSTTPGGVNWSIQYKNGSAFSGNSLATITELDSVLELILWGTDSDEQGWLRLKWYRWPTSAQNVLLQANQATNNVSSEGSYTVELPNHAGKIVAHTGFITKTASTIADITMENRRVRMNVASANTFTVPSSSVPFSIGAQIDVIQYWTGQTTIAAGSGVTIRSEWGKMKIAAQYVGVTLIKIAEDEWLLVWNLST